MNKNRAGSVSKYLTRSGARLWRYRFDADADNGKRRQVSQAGFLTRGAAMDALQNAVKEYRQSKTLLIAPMAVKETVGDWVRIWLRDYAPHQCAPKTIERYHQLAGYILNAAEGAPAVLAATPLADLKHLAVETALYALLRMPAKRRKHLSPKSVREIAGVLSVSLNEAFRLDKVLVNPLLKVRLPKVERVEARALTPEEMDRLRNKCRGDWTLTFVDISLATGARRGELLALEWSDIDWLAVTLTVSKSLEQTSQGLRVKRPKSGHVRKFRLGQTAIASLHFLHECQQEHRRLIGPDYQGDLVFCRPDGAFRRQLRDGYGRPPSTALRCIRSATRTRAICYRKASRSRRSPSGSAMLTRTSQPGSTATHCPTMTPVRPTHGRQSSVTKFIKTGRLPSVCSKFSPARFHNHLVKFSLEEFCDIL